MSTQRQPFCTDVGALVIGNRLMREAAALPYSHTRANNVQKRSHPDDDTELDDREIPPQADGYFVPYETFLEVESERNNYSRRLLKQLSAVHLIAKTNRKLVNAIKVVSSKAVISHFNRKDQQLVLFDIEEDVHRIIPTVEDYFETDNVMFIASWKEFVLAYTVPYLDDGEAALVLIDMESITATKIQVWDLLVYWNQRHLMKAEQSENGMPTFGCTVSNDGDLVLIMGPSESFGTDWGCKLLHLPTETFIQTIEIPAFKYAVCACFHPTQYEVAMICKERNFKFTQDHGSKEATGTLVIYDLRSNAIKSVHKEQQISTDVIKYSPDGRILIVRFDNIGAIGLLDSRTLKCYRFVEHDHGPIANNPFVRNILYKMFPMFSSNGSECSILQYKNRVMLGNRDSLSWSDGVKWITKVTIPTDIYETEADDISNGKRIKRELHIR